MDTSPATLAPAINEATTDPVLTRVVRTALTHFGGQLPEAPATLREELTWAYRREFGEHGDSAYAVGPKQAAEHLAALRTSYVKVLASVLNAQFAQLRGARGENARDAEEYALMSDGAIERRLAIDAALRGIETGGPAGTAMFDRLLCAVLGKEPAGIRANPMRPAVFFHALGLAWTKVSGRDRDELEVLRGYGPLLQPMVASLYGTLNKVLAEGLAERLGMDTESLLRRNVPLSVPPPGAEPAEAQDRPDPSPAAQSPRAGSPGAVAHAAPPAPPPSGAGGGWAEQPFHRVAVSMNAALFDRLASDESIPAYSRLQIVRLQMLALAASHDQPTFFVDPEHPLRRLIDALAHGVSATADRVTPLVNGVLRVADDLPSALVLARRAADRLVETPDDVMRREAPEAVRAVLAPGEALAGRIQARSA